MRCVGFVVQVASRVPRSVSPPAAKATLGYEDQYQNQVSVSKRLLGELE
jgi:hypothetical protein